MGFLSIGWIELVITSYLRPVLCKLLDSFLTCMWVDLRGAGVRPVDNTKEQWTGEGEGRE